MKVEISYFHCSDQLKKTLASEIVATVEWEQSFQHTENGAVYDNQAGYNKAFSMEFTSFGLRRRDAGRKVNFNRTLPGL